MPALEINSTDAAAALADKQRARAVMSSVAGANPAQWDDLSIAGKVVCLDALQRDNEAFYE
jgi:hypothetical protein